MVIERTAPKMAGTAPMRCFGVSSTSANRTYALCLDAVACSSYPGLLGASAQASSCFSQISTTPTQADADPLRVAEIDHDFSTLRHPILPGSIFKNRVHFRLRAVQIAKGNDMETMNN